jgi:hypothetical protein
MHIFDNKVVGCRSCHTQSMKHRADFPSAMYVNVAINITATYGLAAGVQALLECGASPEIIERVLIDRGPCRSVAPAIPELLA